MSEIENEVDRGWGTTVTIRVTNPYGEVTELDWELVGRLTAAVGEFDAELDQRRKERQETGISP